MKKTNRTYVGGQAVIQGVMMRGKSGMATVVRDDKGELHMEAKRTKASKKRKIWMRIPFVRGIINFALSLVMGMQALMRSSEVAISDDEEPSKLSKWMADKWKMSLGDVVTGIATILGVALALVLFIYLPDKFTQLIADAAPVIGTAGSIYYNLIEGGFRLVMFIFYIALTLLLPSMRETYRYHGAEHKTINCYEYGRELTVENVKKCSRLHDRCGTTFIFIVLLISILMFALVGWVIMDVAGLEGAIGNKLAEKAILLAVKLLMLPIIAGISYEILKFFARFQSPLVLPFKAPGFLLQLLTTREPTDEMIECAIMAFEKAVDMDENPDSPEKIFATETKLSKLLDMMKKKFAEKEIDESDAEWILSLSLDIPRSSLGQERVVTRAECEKILRIYEERLTGRPLWYVIGDTSFYGRTFKVDERVLIPRPETEVLVRQAVSSLKAGDTMLDLCTGSGAIAVSVACAVAKDKRVSITAADISEDALAVAQENAWQNSANVNFIKSDLFENIHGRFNLITANPPYIKSSEISSLPQDVRDFEPRIALDGGVDGLEFYRRIAVKINRYLVRGGMCILEVGEDQAQEVIKIFQSLSRCDFAMVVKDLSGVERVVKIGF
ncbi:MAG: peptide chain release factor N(5)-glutamine methyltransferase [Clostridia bacterium]|nr:peptide chain release factor N(5)-glutamine methyltransferase [Clostridia bacterium]